jgi:hypothetical protein
MPPAAETLERVKAATAYIRCKSGDTMTTGSGFFVSQKGYVVTNAHVIAHPRKKRLVADRVEVGVAYGTADQRLVKARVIGYDTDADLALLKVSDPDLPVPLQFGKADHLVETEDVYLFGFPLGELLGENISVNKTTVSSIRRKGRGIVTVQFAGGSFFGSSGGPVTNMNGEVVGVCQGGIDGSQINFAIPAEIASSFVDAQIESGGFILTDSSGPSRAKSQRRSRGDDDDEDDREMEPDYRGRANPKREGPVHSLSPFTGLRSWVLILAWGIWSMITLCTLLIIGSQNTPLLRFAGIMMAAVGFIPLAELLCRAIGWSGYNPDAWKRPELPPTRLLTEVQLAKVKTAPVDDDDPRLDDDRPVEGPPEEEFWEKHNKRLEFPLATVGTVFMHILIAALGIYIIVGLMGEEDRGNPPLTLMQVGGMDDVGEGSQGSGGQENPDVVKDVDPFKAAKEVLGTPQALKDAQENIKQIVLDDPTGKLPVSAPNAAAYSQLDDTIRKKLLGVGAPKGAGNQPGKGFDGTPGTGPGGTGADSTRARGLRWVLRFKVVGGRDYIEQLRSMGAEVLVPLPPDSKKCLIVRNLNNPQPVIASDADLNRLAGKIQFSDNRPIMVREVLEVLGVNPPNAKAFWAFFPKDLEEELARKEKGYRNRRPEDIEETIFRVTVRGGAFTIEVDDQVAKK